MGALQKVISRVLARLRDVTPSQKIALLLGGALVAVSLIWLLNWAASPEMSPLLNQDLSAEEQAAVTSMLAAVGESYEVRGNRVYVRSGANRQTLLAQLQQQDKLPANTSASFASLVKESDPWISQAENDRRWIVALQSEIEQVLRQFQGVANARVFINLNTSRAHFSRTEPPKSASVTLVMKHEGNVPRPLAMAAARLVAGAVNGLRPESVQVLDASGSPALEWEIEHDATNTLTRLLAQVEKRYTESIRRQVADPKALISVQAELNSTTTSTETEEPVKPVTISEEVERETTTRIRNREAPGVQPNVGAAVGSGLADESQERERTKSESTPGVARKQEATPAGDVKQVTAAISLSNSYLESIFRHANADAKEPTTADIDAVFESERTRLLPQIVKLVRPQVEDNVAISRYYDGAVEPALAAAGGGFDQTVDLVRRYGPQSGLALLALFALGMMLRMAKKGDTGDTFGLELGLPAEAIEAARRAATDLEAVAEQAARAGVRRGARVPAGAGGSGRSEARGGVSMAASGGPPAPDEVIVQQTSATEGMLVAQEVDATTVQTRKMLDQIREMVTTDGDTVASLVEQWIQKNEQYHDGMS